MTDLFDGLDEPTDEPTGDEIIALFRNCSTIEELESFGRTMHKESNALRSVHNGMFFRWVCNAYDYNLRRLRG